jgi:hypothetical protein
VTRAELIRTLVLREICDDFEDILQITNWTVESGSKCGLTVTHDDIIQALRELIEMGHAKAYNLERWTDPPAAENEVPAYEEINPMKPRFSRTEKGLAFQEANSASGPYDENHDLRESWPPPELSIKREELARLFILGSFRNYTHVALWFIERNWKALAVHNGISICRDEFIQAFRKLVALGYLEASYKDEGVWQYDGTPLLEDIKPFGAYFWVTGAGWDFYEARDSWWPFYWNDDKDEFVLRKDWVPPEA